MFNEWSKLFDRKAASAPHMVGSIVFAMWRQCAPPSNACCLGSPESISQTASRSVQLFCTAHGRMSLYFTMDCPFPSKLPLLPLAHPNQHPKRHVDGFSRFCTAHVRGSLQWPPLSISKLSPRVGNLEWTLGPPESTTQTASRSVQRFLQGSRS